ncbi:hypothetical protein J31TS6_22610 [Brevibacillus reuszeri]|uniref:beta family protein n=1 Tax=Brevibacillus reuszeri TaxID=54915 RepID=UPI001B11D4FB|nr:beta family protein [Brevibacillus reuszeri]GIO06233.1 hypothetical protein J31TS6_22610 [Brevibacillus reuszeri]
MFDHKHYVPILRWKRGEQKALEFLDPLIKQKMTPFIELPPIDWDYENDVPKYTIDQQLDGIGQIVKDSWAQDRPVFVDTNILVREDGSSMENGQHVVEYVVNDIEQNGTPVVPVTGYGRDEEFHQAIKNTISNFGNGVCVRLEEDDFDDLTNRLEWILQYYDIQLNEIDLVVDFKYVRPEDEKKTLRYLIGALVSLPNINEWRTLTITSTSVPEDLRDIKTGTDGSINRVEWAIYQSILDQKLSRFPAFGDYVISNPTYLNLDPRVIQIAAGIRYTIEDKYLIFRGKSVRDKRYGGWKQTRELSQRILASGYFKGQTYSYGDGYIYQCANGGNTGNAETWRRVGTNHHLTLAITALSNLHGI